MAGLSSLPTEILQDVFARLDFITLRLSIPFVNRRFHSIILAGPSGTSTDPLSLALFRPASPWDKYKLHPVLEHLRFRKPDSSDPDFHKNRYLSCIGIVSPSRGFLPIHKSTFAEESLLQPANECVEVHAYNTYQRWRGESFLIHNVDKAQDGNSRPANVLQLMRSFSLSLIEGLIADMENPRPQAGQTLQDLDVRHPRLFVSVEVKEEEWPNPTKNPAWRRPKLNVLVGGSPKD